MRRLLPGLISTGLTLMVTGCGSFLSNNPPEVTLTAAGFEPATREQLAPFELLPVASPSPSPAPMSSAIYIVPKGASILLKTKATDQDDPVTLTWKGDVTIAENDSSFATFKAETEGRFFVTVQATDGHEGGTTTQTIGLQVIAPHGAAPKITSFLPDKLTTEPGGQHPLQVVATDADGDTLSYSFLASGGTLSVEKSTNGSSIFTAPTTPDSYTIFCVVSDGHGQISTKSISVTVTAKPSS